MPKSFLTKRHATVISGYSVSSYSYIVACRTLLQVMHVHGSTPFNCICLEHVSIYILFKILWARINKIDDYEEFCGGVLTARADAALLCDILPCQQVKTP